MGSRCQEKYLLLTRLSARPRQAKPACLGHPYVVRSTCLGHPPGDLFRNQNKGPTLCAAKCPRHKGWGTLRNIDSVKGGPPAPSRLFAGRVSQTPDESSHKKEPKAYGKEEYRVFESPEKRKADESAHRRATDGGHVGAHRTFPLPLCIDSDSRRIECRRADKTQDRQQESVFCHRELFHKPANRGSIS